MDDIQQWASALYASATHTAAPPAAPAPIAPPATQPACEWAAAAEQGVPPFLEGVAEQGARRAKKRERQQLAAASSSTPAKGSQDVAKRARQACNRLPMYNLRQVMLWVEECDTKNQEHERAKICRLLAEIYMRLLPKLKKRPTSGCNCNSCVAYKERVRGEALNLGWSVTQTPDQAPYCPHLGEDHLWQD